MTVTEEVPSTHVLVGMFETMTRIKRCDEKFRSMIKAGQIVVTYYSPRGQEVIPSAFSQLLRPDDYVVTIYRGLHDHIGKGVNLRDLWAEFLGKRTGTCKGKGGPMHITDPSSGLMVTTGIVGSGMPIANGFGLAAQLSDTDQVTVVNFGDGASNIGAFHEALNLASVWKLPVIFCCQNNQYAEHTPYAEGTSAEHISDRAHGYSMPGITVDGNDPLAMYAAARDAVQRARAGDGPTLLEAVTYRFHGHIMGDNMSYMPKEERQAAMDADPVPRYREWLIAEGHLTEDAAVAIEESIGAEVDDAADYALSCPAPSADEIEDDVYAEVIR
ncbi:MAG TPA: thiamine pyrophosphate-dependent dehydrogenase E1 component subunit alpha [Acidimicrobiales bacterium]